ncbi:MAG: hypothetical protein ACPLWC_01465 [Candidatus Woesearchaeota archaeon]
MDCNIIKRDFSEVIDKNWNFKNEKAKKEYCRDWLDKKLDYSKMFENAAFPFNRTFIVNENAFETAKNFIKVRMMLYDRLYGGPLSYVNAALFEAFTKKLIDLGFINTKLNFSNYWRKKEELINEILKINSQLYSYKKINAKIGIDSINGIVIFQDNSPIIRMHMNGKKPESFLGLLTENEELSTSLRQQIEDLFSDFKNMQFLEYKPNLIELTDLDIYRLMMGVDSFVERRNLNEKDKAKLKVLSDAYNKISSNPNMIKRFSKEEVKVFLNETSSKDYYKQIFSNFHSKVFLNMHENKLVVIANTDMVIHPEEIYGIKDKKLKNLYEEKDVVYLMSEINKRRKDYYFADIKLS